MNNADNKEILEIRKGLGSNTPDKKKNRQEGKQKTPSENLQFQGGSNEILSGKEGNKELTYFEQIIEILEVYKKELGYQKINQNNLEQLRGAA